VPGLGDAAPAFTLPGTDGKQHAFPPDGDGPAVVVFTCNHCPYALAWQDRLEAVARHYAGRVTMVAVNPNDAERYPGDSFDAMRARVEAEGGWPFPYLRDEDQSVARAFDAKTTPDVFVFDAEGRLAYRGAPDADHQDPSLDAAWLREALDSLLAGERPQRPETEPKGCSVKWK
jgi:peroxiredoxin